MTRFRKLILALVAVCGIAGLGGLWMAGNMMTRSTNADVPDFGPDAEEVRIASSDGVELAGSYWPAADRGRPAVLLLHGNGGHRGDVAKTAAWLNGEGFQVLAIDFRGHGESTPADKSFGLYEARDAKAAFDWLKQQSPEARVGVIGFSLGGSAVVLGDEGPLPADALVLESVFADIRTTIFNRIATHAPRPLAYVIEPLLSLQSLPRFGVWPSRISPIEALREAQSPLMIVGGERDIYTPPAESQAMLDAAGVEGELWILEGLTHDQVVGAEIPAFRARLLSFLRQHLGE